MATVNGIVPARFLTLIAHLIITINLYWTRVGSNSEHLTNLLCYFFIKLAALYNIRTIRKSNVLGKSKLAGHFNTILLELSLTLCAVATAAHASAAVSLSYFVFEQWECDLYWWVFGFCR
ncbi:PREDICTED: transmembrane protein 107-like [Branchiostoma belcheri]|uniref:Transmembrane protein 107 n=1 Tax=Branchiostoma belcheri TaxID=7741 RepID=A0A6P4YU78_BRABE|nr:PREDICTED: transmembrane protein 107-like [Branchiostoma belcheri]